MSLGYEEFLEEVGFVEEQVAVVMATLGHLPYDHTFDSGMVVYPSVIHGVGLHASQPYDLNEMVGSITRDGERAIAARYLNHSDDPTCRPVVAGGDILLVANKPIPLGTELTINYRESQEAAERVYNER